MSKRGCKVYIDDEIGHEKYEETRNLSSQSCFAEVIADTISTPQYLAPRSFEKRIGEPFIERKELEVYLRWLQLEEVSGSNSKHRPGCDGQTNGGRRLYEMKENGLCEM